MKMPIKLRRIDTNPQSEANPKYRRRLVAIEKELKIEQEKAKNIFLKNTAKEANKELCKANPGQLFEEVVTEVVDQRMKMETTNTKMQLAEESLADRVSEGKEKKTIIRFKEIMKDASVRDWKNLAHFSNPTQSVYVYDHESKSVRNPGTEIEWPIV